MGSKNKFNNPFRLLTRLEWGIWGGSVTMLLLLEFVSQTSDLLTLVGSLIGVTALIFVAKGHVLGQILTVVFSLFYALISYQSRYYGEMITYLGMTAPIALLSVISWMKNPYEGGESEVKVAKLTIQKSVGVMICSIVATIVFYFILEYFHTARLFVSTISVTTSFAAASLMFLRSPYYAIAYACNDIVLICLWILASLVDRSNVPMILCFLIFLVNDIYAFYNWKKMRRRQNRRKKTL